MIVTRMQHAEILVQEAINALATKDYLGMENHAKYQVLLSLNIGCLLYVFIRNHDQSNNLSISNHASEFFSGNSIFSHVGDNYARGD